MNYEQMMQMRGVGGGAYPSTEGPSTMQQVSISKELELEIEYLERQLEIKKQMQALFKSNPAIEQFMNLSRGILVEPMQQKLPLG